MKIIKRGKYYYLKHSYREDGRVKTIDRYLGKKVPKNVEEIELELRRESRKEVYAKLEGIKKNFGIEWSRIPESAREREKEEIAIAFTFNTNAIEGSTITLEESREILVDKVAPNKSLKDIRETEMHYSVFLEMLDRKEKLSRALLLEWHRNIFGETKPDLAGRYRDFPVRVGEYRPPDWKDVEGLMKQLLSYTTGSKTNPVELAARSHYRFEKIHPFGDGNGRIGRLIINHILWHSGYPMLIIEYTKRRSYYRALQRDEEGFVNYFLGRYLSAHEKRYA